jgi:hypothetical protein
MASQPTKTTQMSYTKNGPFFRAKIVLVREIFNLNTKEGSISMTHTVVSLSLAHLWHTGSHQIIIVIIINIIPLVHLIPRKSKLTLFRLSLCPYPLRSLGFLELFSNSSLNIFGHLLRGPASHLAITRSI